jgi:hypothetical protein
VTRNVSYETHEEHIEIRDYEKYEKIQKRGVIDDEMV